jgi:hypothetical protein
MRSSGMLLSPPTCEFKLHVHICTSSHEVAAHLVEWLIHLILFHTVIRRKDSAKALNHST